MENIWLKHICHWLFLCTKLKEETQRKIEANANIFWLQISMFASCKNVLSLQGLNRLLPLYFPSILIWNMLKEGGGLLNFYFPLIFCDWISVFICQQLFTQSKKKKIKTFYSNRSLPISLNIEAKKCSPLSSRKKLFRIDHS